MKLFISWSGSLSHKVALTLKEWLPSVIQAVKPYVSSEDINKGARWVTEIAKELDASNYGIICLTKDNITEAWLNFEAGALAKAVDKSYVAPFLFGLKLSDVEGPLVQFQSVVNDEDDIFKMIIGINSQVAQEHRLEASALRKSFDAWWPQLEEDLRMIHDEELTKAPVEIKTRRDPNDILEELLDLARSQQRQTALDVDGIEKALSSLQWEIQLLRMKDSFVTTGGFIHQGVMEQPYWPAYAQGLSGPKVVVVGEVPQPKQTPNEDQKVDEEGKKR